MDKIVYIHPNDLEKLEKMDNDELSKVMDGLFFKRDSKLQYYDGTVKLEEKETIPEYLKNVYPENMIKNN